MKVCFIIGSLNSIGGEQRVLVNTMNNLSSRGIDVYLLLRDNRMKSNPYVINSKVTIIHNSSLVRRKFDYLPQKLFTRFYQNVYKFKNLNVVKKIMFSKKESTKFAKFIERYNFDFIIGVAPNSSALISMMDINAVKIGWLHSTYQRYFETSKDYAWNLGEVFSDLFNDLDEVLVLTESSKKTFEQKLEIMPRVMENALSFNSENKSKLDNNQIIFVGRLDYYIKGLSHLLNLAQHLKNADVEFSIVVIGDGKDKEKFINKIKENLLEKHVFVVGSTDNVAKYYLESSICIVPSNVEGFGLVVIEAMECGLPVVAFKTEGPSEIIQDNVDGYLIDKYDIEDFAEKIKHLLDNRVELKRMGKNAEKKAREYSADMVTDKWIQLFNNYSK